MCAYNAVNGVPACADKGMLTGTLRQEWGFSGYVSDCGAVSYVHTRHNYTEYPSQSVAAVLDAGVDVECFVSNTSYYSSYLQEALNDDLVNQDMLDLALEHAFQLLMRLGYFEKNATRPFTNLLPEIVDSQPHRDLSLTAARQSIVLLKNSPTRKTAQTRRLPLEPNNPQDKQATIALIGPHLNASMAFLANYYGVPSVLKPLWKKSAFESHPFNMSSVVILYPLTIQGWKKPLPWLAYPYPLYFSLALLEVIMV
ncbi:probable beta-D-xylosidase 7 [Folsomia candida]|uniref:probable beta-D-xylosidase 7 n=1 Tax=Folsomia candida TaxID=158441 RepID=UPI000B8EF6A7|nr:probable beta-D-xylosidase 7 [Folsomia candida]